MCKYDSDKHCSWGYTDFCQCLNYMFPTGGGENIQGLLKTVQLNISPQLTIHVQPLHQFVRGSCSEWVVLHMRNLNLGGVNLQQSQPSGQL